MKITLDIPEYDGNAIDVIWENNAKYDLTTFDGEAVLKANKEALISFAKQMLYFAHNDITEGSHVHYGSFFTGKEQKNELIIEITKE